MGKGLRLPAHIGCAGKTNFIVQLPLYMAERSGCEVCRREDRQASNPRVIPKYFCLSRAVGRREPVAAWLIYAAVNGMNNLVGLLGNVVMGIDEPRH